MDGPKLEWMYRNSSEVVDKEEYLLGRPIDKAFEQSSYGNEIEKDCLPTPILSSSVSNVQVDVLRKLKEDPLEIIRQQELERRKQLLKNPVKLKKLQNMLKEKEETQKEDKRKKSKKKSKSNKSSNEDIDNLLTSKYLSLMKKHGIKSLSDLANMKVDKKKKRKKEGKHVSSSDTSDSESEEDNHKHSKKFVSRRKYHESSSSSSDSENEKIAKQQRRKHRENLDESNSKNVKEVKKKYHRSRSRSPLPKLPFKDQRPQGNNRKDFRNQKDHFRDMKHRGPEYNSSQKGKSSSGLSEKEKQKRLEEMMENAKWRDEVRIKNVDRYKKEEAAEKKDREYNEDFLRKQMAIATSVGTVESRIKSNINNIQRSKFSMNENFARR